MNYNIQFFEGLYLFVRTKDKIKVCGLLFISSFLFGMLCSKLSSNLNNGMLYSKLSSNLNNGMLYSKLSRNLYNLYILYIYNNCNSFVMSCHVMSYVGVMYNSKLKCRGKSFRLGKTVSVFDSSVSRVTESSYQHLQVTSFIFITLCL